MATRRVQGEAGTLEYDVVEPAAAATLPVVLVHGINMDRSVWSGVAQRLGEVRTVLVPDLRGHGGSDRRGPFAATDYAADVLAVLDDAGVERAHVVGTSFGGSVACALAATVPERVASIAALGSAIRVEGLDIDGAVGALEAVGVRDFFAGFLPQASFAPGTDPALVEKALDAAATDRDVPTVVEVARTALTADSTSFAEAVRCPALVATGELDMTCPVPLGAEMARVLGTEHVVLPGRGHVVTMEDPGGVADLLEKHLATHDPDA